MTPVLQYDTLVATAVCCPKHDTLRRLDLILGRFLYGAQSTENGVHLHSA